MITKTGAFIEINTGINTPRESEVIDEKSRFVTIANAIISKIKLSVIISDVSNEPLNVPISFTARIGFK